MISVWIFILFAAVRTSSIEHDYKGFDDSILFALNWPGSNDELNKLLEGVPEENKPILQNKEILKVTTSNKETYECQLPELFVNEPNSIEDYNGPSPFALLKPLFSQKHCSYRLETYWNYEVCHGRYVRQYHEERDGKQIKSQQYYLGNWDAIKQKKLEEEMENFGQRTEKPLLTKVDGLSVPYIEMVMGDGSVCDLSGKPRVTRVRYVCYTHGKHEVYSFKETLTCEYEIVILSPLLCLHPQFVPQHISENAINCLPVGDSPKKPRNLLAFEAESLKLHHQTVRLSNNDRDHPKEVVAVWKIEKIEKDGETHLKFEIRPLSEAGDLEETSTAAPPNTNQLPEKVVTPISDDSPVRAFLNGDDCLIGGTGWWKYLFCYGKRVEQYHMDRSGGRSTVLLGTFDEKTHLEWIKENRSKAPKPKEHRTSISHFYSNGDICDKTGKPRQTEVKLKCLENSSSSAQVSLYLLEPKTCQYILGVESPLICDILPLADENGLVSSAITLTLNTTPTPKAQKDKSKTEQEIKGPKKEIKND